MKQQAPKQLTAAAFIQGCQDYVAAAASHGNHSLPYTYARHWVWREHALLPSLSHMRRTFDLAVELSSKTAQGVKVRTEEQRTASAIAEDADQDREASLLLDTNHEIGSSAEEEDAATVTVGPALPNEADTQLTNIRVDQLVLYSSTWKVPVLYLGILSAAHSEGGRIVTLPEMLASSLFHASSVGQGTTPPLQQQRFEGEADIGTNSQASLAYFPALTTCEYPLGDEDGSFSAYEAAVGPHGLWMYLHPCQTAQVVGEILAAARPPAWIKHQGAISQSSGEPEGDVPSKSPSNRVSHDEHRRNEAKRYLEAFMAVCASAVEMRA